MTEEKKRCQSSQMGVGISLGLAIGAGFGVAMDNLAAGIGAGLAIGVGLGAAFDASKARHKDDESDE